MKDAFLAVFLAALCTAPTSAQGIDVPATVKIGEPIVATLAADVPAKAQVRGSWTVEAGTYLPGAQPNTIHIWAAAGTHTITAAGVWVLTKDVKVGDQTVPVLVDFGQYSYTATFTVGDGGPDPVPPPPVPPIKNPWLIIVEETSQRTPELAKLLMDLRKQIHAQLVIADKDQPAASLAPYLKLADGEELPVLFVVGEDGNVAFRGPLPATVDGVQKLLQGDK